MVGSHRSLARVKGGFRQGSLIHCGEFGGKGAGRRRKGEVEFAAEKNDIPGSLHEDCDASEPPDGSAFEFALRGITIAVGFS